MNKNISEYLKYGLDKKWSDKLADYYYELWWLSMTGTYNNITGDSAWATRIAKRYGIKKPTKEKKHE